LFNRVQEAKQGSEVLRELGLKLLGERQALPAEEHVDGAPVTLACGPAEQSPFFRNAGRLAIQVAKPLGAGHVTGVGRAAVWLAALGADAVVALDGDGRTVARELAESGEDVDVVIDYLWGQPTRDALYAIIPHRTDGAQPLAWIQVGSVAGDSVPR